MMLDKALTAIGQYSMLAHGDTVVVGLSGGADSVCLLSLMCSLREKYDLRLLAAHINHGIRGSEAERDERFCKELCEKMNVPFRVLHADIPKLSRESGEGVEECGRRVRYEFFSSLAGEGGKIATAHNMNDAAETLIFNLTRGSSLRGAGSIAPVRDNIIRPLITTPRSEVEEYLHKAGLSFVIDSTNLENVYTRNKIRNTVLPVLTEINPSAVGALAGFAARAREDEALLNKLAEAELERICRNGELDAAEFSALDISLRRRAARLYISRFTDADVLNKHIEDFIDFALGEAELQSAGALRLVNRQGVIKPYCRDAEQFAIKIENVPCEIEYPYGRVGIKQCSEKDLQNLNKELLEMCVDCDKIGDNLELRSRREGDSIELVKRSVTKSLKKLFNEDRIPADRRNTVPVLACEKGVVWVGGYGVSREYRVDKNTEKALIITMMQGEN